jgi:hypothetical protein
MAIMGFIVVVAGRAFSDSTRMRVRSQNMLASSEEAGRVSAILKEDISQMGAKSVVNPGANADGSYTLDIVEGVYTNFNGNPKDLSSYTLTKNNPSTDLDKLEFRKLHYDATGKCGHLLIIEWSVANNILMRKCRVTGASKPAQCTGAFEGDADCPGTNGIEMARNVKSFKLLPSKPGTSSLAPPDVNFPSSGNLFKFLSTYGSGGTSPGDNATRYTLGGFTKNPSTSGPPLHSEFYLADVNQTTCKSFNFKKDEIYSIDFFLRCDDASCKRSGTDEKYGSMVMFQPGHDHLSVGLRNTSKTDGTVCTVANAACTPDFLFYPPQNTSANKVRHFEFSVPQDVTACIGITAAFYSPAADGILDLQNFKVSRKTDNVHYFDRANPAYNPTSALEKATVKAFELTLEIDRKSEINKTVTVIPVPNNGTKPAEESTL